MRYEFALPDLGEGLTEAEISHWLISVGDTVSVDQAVVEVQTAKALVEISSPVAGVVIELSGEDGAMLPVGSLLIAFDTETAPVALSTSSKEDPGHVDRPPSGTAQLGRTPTAETTTAPPRRVLATPSVRREAWAAGIDIQKVPGSGPNGRVTRADVQDAVAAAKATSRPTMRSPTVGRSASAATPASDAHDRVESLRGIRRQIAHSMTQAWQRVPHITEFRQIDATGLVDAYRALRSSAHLDAPRLTYLPLFAMACIRALQRHPVVNGEINLEDDTITYHSAINLGIATSTDDGLVVPILHDAAALDLSAISSSISELSRAARERRIRPEHLTGGTFTITNFGSYGTRLGTPIVNPPQVAIAGFGRIHEAVIAVDGEARVRAVLPIAVAADHRLIDGDILGGFVNELADALEHPYLLIAGYR